MLKLFKKSGRKGQSLVEYGLILALVSVVAIGILGTMGGNIEGTLRNVNTQMQKGTVAPTP